ncbi:MAG: murein biosynthesis integral membrane protein MurJ [Planctomycetaceae bacterium]|nr:murein biosynthesis integral membrane protein MurJ [Planctomycetaceae bacterium]
MHDNTATTATAADEQQTQVRSTWTVGSLTMVSRVLGFLRLVLLVQLFSQVRWASDAFIFAFRIPNLFRNLLGEGALSAAFIPAFVKTERKDGKYSAGVLGSQAFTLLTLISGAICVVGIVVCLIIDGFTGSREVSLALRLTALLFPFMPLICLAALLAGMLQSLRRFALPAAMSILLNIGFLAGFAYVYWWQAGGDLTQLRAESATYAIAVFVLLAGALEVLVMLPALAGNGVLVRPIISFNHPALREAIRAFLPVAVGLGLVQINAFIDSLIAGWLSLGAPGAVTYLEVGFRFMQLPLGVFGVAIATVSFPSFAAAGAEGNNDLLCQRLVRSLRMSLFFILPCAAVLIAMADPIIRLTCQRPDLDFTHAAVYRSALVLILYSFGLAFYSARQILVRAFYARGEYTYPVKVAAAMVGLNLILNLTLIHLPDLFRLNSYSYYHAWNLADASFPGGLSLGEAGLALATCLTAIVDVCILGFALRKRVTVGLSVERRSEEFTKLWHTAARMVIASIALGILTWLYRNSIPYDPSFPKLLERVVFPGVLACGTFYILGIIIPLPEMGEFLWSLFRRGRKA